MSPRSMIAVRSSLCGGMVSTLPIHAVLYGLILSARFRRSADDNPRISPASYAFAGGGSGGALGALRVAIGAGAAGGGALREGAGAGGGPDRGARYPIGL